MKLYYILINVILSAFCIYGNAIAQQNLSAVKCIAIDAGHGGKDPGAVNGKLFEKNVTLSVALKLGAQIKAKYPEIKIIYTRKDDTFIALQTRSAIANKADADLFISIHTNAAKNSAAVGTETYVMGVDKTGANLSVAMRENDVITFETDYSTKYQGYEPGSSESFIIFSLMNNAYQAQSLRMAELVQKEFGAGLPMKNRGVKQAGYLVLWHTAMPSILTEIGFISNPEESKYLGSEKGQEKIAQLLFKATSSYIEEMKKVDVKIEKETEKKEIPPVEKKETVDQVVNDVYFRVLALESAKPTVVNSQKFGPFVSVVEEVKDDKSHKYYIEKLFSYKEALLLHQKIQDLIPSATIVAFRGAKQITVDEAKKIKP